MGRSLFVILALVIASPCRAQLSPQEIIRRSGAANERDWEAAPTFAYREREVQTKGDSETDQTFEVRMVLGSPYRRLVEMNGQPLSPARQKQEEKLEQREIARRRSESPEEKEKRIHKYQQERAQDHLLMNEMAHAFTFRLLGEEKVSDHFTYVLEATPKPDYKPVNRDSKVLTGMKGKLWVEKTQFHWAKVEAEVVRSVSFHFIAKVGPGTRFLLEKEPVNAQIWQPKRFAMHLATSILGWQRKSGTEDTFTNYRAQ